MFLDHVLDAREALKNFSYLGYSSRYCDNRVGWSTEKLIGTPAGELDRRQGGHFRSWPVPGSSSPARPERSGSPPGTPSQGDEGKVREQPRRRPQIRMLGWDSVPGGRLADPVLRRAASTLILAMSMGHINECSDGLSPHGTHCTVEFLRRRLAGHLPVHCAAASTGRRCGHTLIYSAARSSCASTPIAYPVAYFVARSTQGAEDALSGPARGRRSGSATCCGCWPGSGCCQPGRHTQQRHSSAPRLREHRLARRQTGDSVILALVYGYIPYLILPVYAGLDRVDQRQIEAARDLGHSTRRTSGG